MSDIPAKPRWLDEEPALIGLLGRFLDMLDANRMRLKLKVSEKTLPELFDFQDEDTEFLWSLVQSLDRDYHLLTIKLARVQPFQPEYQDAVLQFQPEKEPVARAWLERPAFDPYLHIWQERLKTLGKAFEDGGAALVATPVRSLYGADRTLKAFSTIGRELVRPISLRTLSARCFWGDSKFLDQREDLVRTLFPEASKHLLPRPLLVVASVNGPLQQVVFVENQDSFLTLAGQKLPDTAVIYSAGFRGSAAGARSSGRVTFTFLESQQDGQSDPPAAQALRRWWSDTTSDLPTYFWGDLDFAGMAILKALRQSFVDIRAWQPGYLPLTRRLEQRLGHPQTHGGKERQVDPQFTGCPFADNILLPAMRESSQFIDQEAVTVGELNGQAAP